MLNLLYKHRAVVFYCFAIFGFVAFSVHASAQTEDTSKQIVLVNSSIQPVTVELDGVAISLPPVGGSFIGCVEGQVVGLVVHGQQNRYIEVTCGERLEFPLTSATEGN